MDNRSAQVREKKSNKSLIWIVLFALSAILNVVQWQRHSAEVGDFQMKNDSLTLAKMDVDKELKDTYQELNQYKGINERLDSLLAEANTNIETQKERIDKLSRSERNSTSLNKKLKAELEEIRKLRDEYLTKIDHLLVENEQLKKDKTDLASTVETLSKNLETTVSQASVLKTEYLNVKSYRKKGSNKYSETAMAKRTNKMDVCFSVLDNRIARAGEKDVYLRIVEPGGKTLGKREAGSSTFKMANSAEEVQYTATTKMRYDNTRQDICMNWEEQERVFTPGTYIVEVYIDGLLSSSTTYVLK